MIYDWRLCIAGEDGFMGGIVVMDLQQKDVFLHISDTYALISQLNWFILVHILYAPSLFGAQSTLEHKFQEI